MKTFGVLVVSALFPVLTALPVDAQQAGSPHDHPRPSAGPSAAPPAVHGPGMRGGTMPMMDMCNQMMGGMPGMHMGGGAMPTDPKERAAMLEMRGEMMKAMGEIMMKHARRIHGTPDK